jgi:uncharacterized membrane protein YfcA
MTFDSLELAVLVAGALAGGFVSGLTGFGLALTAIPVWLHVASPPLVAALATSSSVVSQAQTFHLIWRHIEWRRFAWFVLPGLVGVPLGTLILPLVDLRLFKLGVGIVLIAYCAFQLLSHRLGALGLSSEQGRAADAAIGFGGGVMGGLAGLSGPLPIAWATFKPWSRDQKRALFQVFNTVILFASFCSLAVSGLLPSGFWLALAISIPGTIVGARLGSALYLRLDDRRFDRIVVALLLATGIALVATSW